MRPLAGSTFALICTALLSDCSSAPSTFFSTPGIEPGAAGQTESAGSGSAAGSYSAGAENGGAPDTGSRPNSSSAGAGIAGGPATGGAAVGGSSAGGIGGGGAPALSSPSVCDDKAVTSLDALIANFEHGVAAWSGYADGDPFAITSTQPGAAETGHALRFAGGKANTSGVYHLLPCHDVSAFDGLQFWAKGQYGDKVRFLAVIPATDPTPDIGDCHEPQVKCSDHPGKQFLLSNQWKLYQAPWAALAQLGFGSPAKFNGVVNAVLWINDGKVADFDLAIDEVSLYKNASGG